MSACINMFQYQVDIIINTWPNKGERHYTADNKRILKQKAISTGLQKYTYLSLQYVYHLLKLAFKFSFTFNKSE